MTSSFQNDREKVAHIAERLKVIAHPIRLQIISLLCEGPLDLITLSTRLNLNQTLVSQQLQILRVRKFVAATRRNGFADYRLHDENLRNLVHCMELDKTKSESRELPLAEAHLSSASAG